MKVGQQVPYISADGKRHTATITGIPGAGASQYKLLDLEFTQDGEKMVDTEVPHQGDAAEGSAFWLLKGEKRLRGVDDAPLEAAPVVDAQAFPEPGLGVAPAERAPRGVRAR